MRKHSLERNNDSGEEVIASSAKVNEVLEIFASVDAPQCMAIPGTRLLGAGKFSYAFLVDGVVMKVSSPTSNHEYHETGVPTSPEDLVLQYDVLNALRSHLDSLGDDRLTTPRQLFVATTHNSLILAQEYMEGWTSLENQTFNEYGFPGMLSEEKSNEIREWTGKMRDRLNSALGSFALRDSINDIGLHKPEGLHGGNLLVPAYQPLNGQTSLCIIDQPKEFVKI